MFAMADKGDAPRWFTPVIPRQVPARAILLAARSGFISMFLNVGSDKRADCGTLHSAHQRVRRDHAHRLLRRGIGALSLPVHSERGARIPGPKRTADIIAALATIAILIVMSSMAFIPGMGGQLYPSLALLAAVLIALAIKAPVGRKT
jgi:hypothetical protein